MSSFAIPLVAATNIVVLPSPSVLMLSHQFPLPTGDFYQPWINPPSVKEESIGSFIEEAQALIKAGKTRSEELEAKDASVISKLKIANIVRKVLGVLVGGVAATLVAIAISSMTGSIPWGVMAGITAGGIVYTSIAGREKTAEKILERETLKSRHQETTRNWKLLEEKVEGSAHETIFFEAYLNTQFINAGSNSMERAKAFIRVVKTFAEQQEQS